MRVQLFDRQNSVFKTQRNNAMLQSVQPSWVGCGGDFSGKACRQAVRNRLPQKSYKDNFFLLVCFYKNV